MDHRSMVNQLHGDGQEASASLGSQRSLQVYGAEERWVVEGHTERLCVRGAVCAERALGPYR